MRDVASGLARASLLPVGRGELELSVSATRAAILAQLEASYRMSIDTSFYGFIRASSDWHGGLAATLGAGARF